MQAMEPGAVNVTFSTLVRIANGWASAFGPWAVRNEGVTRVSVVHLGVSGKRDLGVAVFVRTRAIKATLCAKTNRQTRRSARMAIADRPASRGLSLSPPEHSD